MTFLMLLRFEEESLWVGSLFIFANKPRRARSAGLSDDKLKFQLILWDLSSGLL